MGHHPRPPLPFKLLSPRSESRISATLYACARWRFPLWRRFDTAPLPLPSVAVEYEGGVQ